MAARIFLFWILLFTGLPLFAQTACSKFHSGKFKYEDPQFEGVIVTREGNRQTEYEPATGRKIVLKIHWADECTYTLKHKHSNSKQDKVLKKGVITVRIIESEGNRYKYEAYVNGQKIGLTGYIVKID